jgi:outer membrane protein TolC
MKHLTLLPRPLATGLVVATLTGCITAPTPDQPTAPWTPPSGNRAGEQVWDDLRQRRPDLSQPLTLAQLSDLALQHSAATRQAWHTARAAAAQVDKAQGLFMPTLTARAGGSYAGVSATPSTSDSQTLRYGPGLQMNYLVMNFGGGRAAAVEQALQTVFTVNHQFNQTIQDTLWQVESAYFLCLSARAGLEAAQASVTDAAKSLEAAQARNTAGVATALDVLQAQAAHDQALYQQATVHGQWQIARGALATAVGLPADAPVNPAPTRDELPAGLETNEIRRIVDEAIAGRADLAALRANLAARQSAIRVAEAAAQPNLYLNALLERTHATALSGSLQGPERQWGYGMGFNVQWNLFDGWQTESEIRMAHEQAQAAEALLEQAELAASAEAWMRFHAFETARRKYLLSVSFCTTAEAARNLAAEAYRAGLKTFLDLLNADTQLATARSQRVTARQETFAALANLNHAIGRLATPPATPDQIPPRKE